MTPRKSVDTMVEPERAPFVAQSAIPAVLVPTRVLEFPMHRDGARQPCASIWSTQDSVREENQAMDYRKAAEETRSDVIAFAQKLIQTPSTSGQEGDLAQLMIAEMKKLNYDEAFIDDMGNTVGVVRGTGGEGAVNIMFNCHMDHVDPGREDAWEYPPYGGVIDKGYIHGRGASDVEGAIASEIYAVGLIKKLGLKTKGDLIVTGVVQEEPAERFGMKHLMDVTFPTKGLKCDFVILGEATSLNVYLGHRGRAELEVQTFGRTSHGSAPWRGINAVYKMLPVIEGVKELDPRLPPHEFLGKSTIALTIISCSPGRLSIIPDICTVSLDRRFLPSETIDDAIRQIEDIFARIKETDPEFKATVKVREVEEVSYKGVSGMCRKVMEPWITPRDHPYVEKTFEALREIGANPQVGRWDFGTDGSYTAGVLGIPTIGYSPGEEHYAHTPYDRVNIDYIVESVAGTMAIAKKVAG